MVRPIGEQLGVTDVIATRMVVEDGRYTGEVEFYAAGPTKAEAVRELAKERGYDLADSLRLLRLDLRRPAAGGRRPPDGGQPGPRRCAAARARARLAGAGVPPPGARWRAACGERPAVPVAAAALGVGVGRRDRHAPVRPAPPGPGTASRAG